MTYREAARRVLRDAGVSMTTAEITQAALAKKLIKPQGKTPAATMSATLYRADSTIRREDRPGAQRAVRGSVRWKYVAA